MSDIDKQIDWDLFCDLLLCDEVVDAYYNHKSNDVDDSTNKAVCRHAGGGLFEFVLDLDAEDSMARSMCNWSQSSGNKQQALHEAHFDDEPDDEVVWSVVLNILKEMEENNKE